MLLTRRRVEQDVEALERGLAQVEAVVDLMVLLMPLLLSCV